MFPSFDQIRVGNPTGPYDIIFCIGVDKKYQGMEMYPGIQHRVFINPLSSTVFPRNCPLIIQFSHVNIKQLTVICKLLGVSAHFKEQYLQHIEQTYSKRLLTKKDHLRKSAATKITKESTYEKFRKRLVWQKKEQIDYVCAQFSQKKEGGGGTNSLK